MAERPAWVSVTLDDAIAQFLAARTDLAPGSVRGYRGILGELANAYPGYFLEAFEPPAGSELIDRLLKDRWGDKTPDTYRKSFTSLRTFFNWQRDQGNLSGNPTDGLS